jgi:hypothetical protein
MAKGIKELKHAIKSTFTFFTTLLLVPLAALHSADKSKRLPTTLPAAICPDPKSMLKERGLPMILYNNDGEDLTAQAYYPIVTQSTGNFLWVPNGRHIPIQPVSSLDDYLAYRLGPLAHSPVKGLSYCGNFGSAIWNLKHEGSAAAGRDNLAALGDDPLQPIVNWWKRDGRTFFFSMRMNDLHHAWMNFPSMWDSVRRAQKHLFLKPPTEEEWQTQFVPWLDGKGPNPVGKIGLSSTNMGYDYSLAQVREHYLGILAEACRRYDLDGVEFDWLRAAIYFRKGEVNAEIMTEFVGQAHAILAEAANRRGHPVRLVCRVPDTPEKALDVGLDVEAWLKAGWIDAVIAGDGDFFSACGIDQWVRLAHLHGVPVYGALDRASWGGMRFARFGSPETMRAAVATLWQKGADGIYLFNFYAKEESPLLADLYPARLARLPKEYFLDPDFRRLPGIHLTGMLSNGTRAQGPIPVECKTGETASATLIIADDPAKAKDLRLELVWKGSGDFAPPGVRINGQALERFTTERGKDSLTVISTSREMAKLLRRGANEFAFTATAPAKLTALSVLIKP